MVIVKDIGTRKGQCTIVIYTLFPASLANSMEGFPGAFGIHKRSAVKGYPHDDLVPSDAFRSVPMDGLGRADWPTKEIGLVIGNAIPRSG